MTKRLTRDDFVMDPRNPDWDKIRRLEAAREEAKQEAIAAFAALPLAGATRECPKCRFGMLTYRYRSCTYLGDGAWAARDNDAYLRYSSAMLIVRNCPQCGAECFERPADSINDYQQETA
jgi:hypothetical protein